MPRCTASITSRSALRRSCQCNIAWGTWRPVRLDVYKKGFSLSCNHSFLQAFLFARISPRSIKIFATFQDSRSSPRLAWDHVRCPVLERGSSCAPKYLLSFTPSNSGVPIYHTSLSCFFGRLGNDRNLSLRLFSRSARRKPMDMFWVRCTCLNVPRKSRSTPFAPPSLGRSHLARLSSPFIFHYLRPELFHFVAVSSWCRLKRPHSRNHFAKLIDIIEAHLASDVTLLTRI